MCEIGLRQEHPALFARVTAQHDSSGHISLRGSVSSRADLVQLWDLLDEEPVLGGDELSDGAGRVGRVVVVRGETVP